MLSCVLPALSRCWLGSVQCPGLWCRQPAPGHCGLSKADRRERKKDVELPVVFSNAVQGSDGQRWSARAEAEELCGASASPPPALSVPVLFRAEVGPPAQKRGPSGCPAWSPAPLCRSRGTRLSHSPSCSSRGGASKRLIWLGSPCQEELRTSGRGGLEGLRCARRGGALRERWGDLLSRRSLVRCSLPRGRRVGARPEGRQPRRNRVPTYWRHRGQSDLLEVQRWMHSLQKMCLQGSARTASAIGPRQMGHGSSWASGGHAHASRLLLAAASRLMAAAALAPIKGGFAGGCLLQSSQQPPRLHSQSSRRTLLSHALARSQWLVLPQEDVRTSRVASKTQRGLGPLGMGRNAAHCEVTG